MMPRRNFRLLAPAVAVLCLTGLLLADAPGGKKTEPKTKFTPEAVAFFEKEVRPILKAHCLKCHGDNPKKIRGSLRLTNREELLKGGDLGPSVALDKPKHRAVRTLRSRRGPRPTETAPDPVQEGQSAHVFH